MNEFSAESLKLFVNNQQDRHHVGVNGRAHILKSVNQSFLKMIYSLDYFFSLLSFKGPPFLLTVWIMNPHGSRLER